MKNVKYLQITRPYTLYARTSTSKREGKKKQKTDLFFSYSQGYSLPQLPGFSSSFLFFPPFPSLFSSLLFSSLLFSSLLFSSLQRPQQLQHQQRHQQQEKIEGEVIRNKTAVAVVTSCYSIVPCSISYYSINVSF